MHISKKLDFKVLYADLKGFTLAHKAVSTLIAVALVSTLYGSVHTTSASAETRYVLGTVSRGTVVTSVSGTGTVSASDQIDLKSKATGDVLSVSVKAGDTVAQGQLLATLDAQDAYDAYRNAEISYEKLTEAADVSTVSSAQSALVSAQTSEIKSYNDAEDDMSSMFLDTPTILDGLDALYNAQAGYLYYLNATYVSDTALSLRNTGGSDLSLTKAEYDSLVNEYKNITRTSATSTVQAVLSHAYTVSKDLAQTLKETKTAVDYMKANSPVLLAAQGTTAQSDVATWTGENATHLSALLADESGITTTHLSVQDKQAALNKVNGGADALDVESAELNLEEKREAYNDAFIRAPFTGIVGKMDIKKGDEVSSGTVVATLITHDEVATVSLNEVDAAKVKTGDKATLTFDAVDDLSIAGTVSEIDLVGTVTQGVVTYSAKITFDSQDPRVLPGMSVSAEIITDSKVDALVVPSSAVKTQNGASYVQVFDPPLDAAAATAQGVVSSVLPTRVPVTVGIAGDTTTEIVSGLTEGEQIVVRTTSSAATATATAQAGGGALFGGGAGRTTGGTTRALGR